ncbi:unnamed protein product [Victoria cruziana]
MIGEEEEGIKGRKLFRELNQGRQLAHQLLNLLDSPAVEDDGVLKMQRALVEAVVRSIEAAILVLRPGGGRNPAGNQDGGNLESPVKERGGNKKRKVEQMATTTSVIRAFHYEDGYAWRKYGQKNILGSKHPRNYFRCTHKLDQGCPALKQVQQLDHDSSLLQVIYKWSHTCKYTHRIPEMDGADLCDEKQGFLLNFETKSTPSGFSSFAGLKQEDNETLSELTTEPGHRTGRTSSLDLDAGEPSRVDGACCFPDMGLLSFPEFEDIDQSLEFFSS